MLTEDNRELLEKYFDKESDYYIEQMEGFNESGKYSLHIEACFLGILWMAYRKMYSHILIIIGIIFVLRFIEKLLLDSYIISFNTYDIINKISWYVSIALFGTLSNRLYLTKSRKKIEKILNKNLNKAQIDELIAESGGVSKIAPYILLFVIVILNYMYL